MNTLAIPFWLAALTATLAWLSAWQLKAWDARRIDKLADQARVAAADAHEVDQARAMNDTLLKFAQEEVLNVRAELNLLRAEIRDERNARSAAEEEARGLRAKLDKALEEIHALRADALKAGHVIQSLEDQVRTLRAMTGVDPDRRKAPDRASPVDEPAAS